MHTFLSQQINWNHFHMEVCDRYVKGMPIQTFESILQNISTRLQLYHASIDKTYNARSISMLASESFFTDIKHLDKEGKGYPKAANMEKLIGKADAINAFKHYVNKYVHFLQIFLLVILVIHIDFYKLFRINQFNVTLGCDYFKTG